MHSCLTGLMPGFFVPFPQGDYEDLHRCLDLEVLCLKGGGVDLLQTSSDINIGEAGDMDPARKGG